MESGLAVPNVVPNGGRQDESWEEDEDKAWIGIHFEGAFFGSGGV